MDPEQLFGVSKLWVGHKEPKSYYFSKVKLIFAFYCVNLLSWDNWNKALFL